jgi:hypothetical protein
MVFSSNAVIETEGVEKDGDGGGGDETGCGEGSGVESG